MSNSDGNTGMFLPMDELPSYNINHGMSIQLCCLIINLYINGRGVRLIRTHMQYEFIRYLTFCDFPRSPVSIWDFVTAGFYFSQNSDNVVCYCCGYMRGNWIVGEIPSNVHQRFSPGCTFFNSNVVSLRYNVLQVERREHRFGPSVLPARREGGDGFRDETHEDEETISQTYPPDWQVNSSISLHRNHSSFDGVQLRINNSMDVHLNEQNLIELSHMMIDLHNHSVPRHFTNYSGISDLESSQRTLGNTCIERVPALVATNEEDSLQEEHESHCQRENISEERQVHEHLHHISHGNNGDGDETAIKSIRQCFQTAVVKESTTTERKLIYQPENDEPRSEMVANGSKENISIKFLSAENLIEPQDEISSLEIEVSRTHHSDISSGRSSEIDISIASGDSFNDEEESTSGYDHIKESTEEAIFHDRLPKDLAEQETIDHQSDAENKTHDIPAAPLSTNASFSANGTSVGEERKKCFHADFEDKAGKQEQADVEKQASDIQAAPISPNASRSANGTVGVKERKKSYDADTEDLAGEQETNDLQPGVENQTHVTQAAQISANSSLSANGEEDRKKSNGADTEAGKQVTIDHQGDLENQTHDLPAAPISTNLSFSANGTSGGEERKKSNDADIEDDEEEINLQNGEVNQKHDITAAPITPNSSFSANDSLSEEEIAKSNDTEVLVGKQETTVHQSGAISPSSSFSASGDERQKIYCAEPEVRKSDACKVSETPPRKGPKVEMENPNHMCHDAGEHISTRPSPITHESVNEDEASQYNVKMRSENGNTLQFECDQDTKTVIDAQTSKESCKDKGFINNGERGKVHQESKAPGKSSPSLLDQSQMKRFSPDVDLKTDAIKLKKGAVDRSQVVEADDGDSNLSLISSGLKKIKDQERRNSVEQNCLKLILQALRQEE